MHDASDKDLIRVANVEVIENEVAHVQEDDAMPVEKIDENVMEKVHSSVSEIATVVVKVNREKMLGSKDAVKKVH